MTILGILASGTKATPVLPITANLTGHWDASDASTVTLNGSRVSQLNDKSGNARHMVQSTGANQPVYLTGNRNGLNVLDFADVEFMEPSSTWTQTDMTLFVVTKFDNVDGSNVAVSWSNYDMQLQDGDRNVSGVWSYQLEPGGPGAYYHYTDGSADTNWHYFELVRPNSGNPIATVDNGGTWTELAGGGPLQALSTGKIAIGRRQDTASPLDGKIGEVILYSGQMGSSDRTQVKNYLASKWGF